MQRKTKILQREGGRDKEKHTKQGLCCVHEEVDCSCCCCLRAYILSCKSASFCLCTSARFCFVCAKALSSSIDFFGFWVAAAFHIWFVCSVGDLLWLEFGIILSLLAVFWCCSRLLSSSQILLPSSHLHCLVHCCHCNHGSTFARGCDIHQQ